MSSDREMKSRWINGVAGPASDMSEHVGHVDAQLRGLMDMPSDVPLGAKEVAILTVIAQEQGFSFDPAKEALEFLSSENIDWSRSFLVANEVTPQRGFSWKRQPFRKYESFTDFYRRELEEKWGPWCDLKRIIDQVAEGIIKKDDVPKTVTELRAWGTNRYSRGSEVTTSIGRGNTYIEARLLRDGFQDLYAKVKANKISHHAAAIKAGFRTPQLPNPLTKLRHWWKKASDEEKLIFRQEILTTYTLE